MTRSISAMTCLDLLAQQTHSLIDVRSEIEFSRGAIPGFVNAPILHDSERHAVGLCYKQAGQEAAIQLGHRLVDPTRDERVRNWIHLASSKHDRPILVACWRGGLRSQIASDWISEAGREQMKVEGGYKAIRAEIIKILADSPSFLVLVGKTGSGKTNLLRQIPISEKLDIEDLAAHRGSSFGKLWHRLQPAQATFENSLGLALRDAERPLLVEDESKVIGSLHLPEPLMRSILTNPTVHLNVGLQERSEMIFQDYIASPTADGIDAEELKQHLVASVENLKRRLGGALTSQISNQIRAAFASVENAHEGHLNWIQTLLKDYYDRSYDHSSSKSERPIAFQGSYEECHQWILQRYV